MLEKYKMENIVKFSVIILAFVFIGNWIALQFKIYALLYPLSIIALIGTAILVLAFLIEFYKSIKKAKEENINIKKI
jgi:ABC-type polysaccharide/polyol phosphate export permease